MNNGGRISMTRLDRLREDLAKADITLANARKRKAMLMDRIKKEEQLEIQSLMDNRGLSLEDVREMLTGSTATQYDENGGEIQ